MSFSWFPGPLILPARPNHKAADVKVGSAAGRAPTPAPPRSPPVVEPRMALRSVGECRPSEQLRRGALSKQCRIFRVASVNAVTSQWMEYTERQADILTMTGWVFVKCFFHEVVILGYGYALIVLPAAPAGATANVPAATRRCQACKPAQHK